MKINPKKSPKRGAKSSEPKKPVAMVLVHVVVSNFIAQKRVGVAKPGQDWISLLLLGQSLEHSMGREHRNK